MISIDDNDYNLCLFDTNSLSDFLKNPKQWISYFKNKYSSTKTIICYSIFTLSELWFRRDLFEKYLEIFSVFPSIIMDSYKSIAEKELKNYRENSLSAIDPILLFPFTLRAPSLSPKERLKIVIENSGFIEESNDLRNSRQEILEGMLSFKQNYSPKNKKYSIKEIEEFVSMDTERRIISRSNSFSDTIMVQNDTINIDQFPSIKCSAYFIFYKFYQDKRNPELSDVFDILIAALFPYVDYVITEGNICNIVSQIQKRHNFLKNIEYDSIKDINKIITYT